MGIYLNPGYAGFEEIRRDIYVDKSGLIAFINSLIGKPKPLVSFSRPRRFGKSYDANMVCAYYDKSCDSGFLFEDLKIAQDDSFRKHLNQYNVITFDVTGFIADAKDNDTDIVLNIKNTLLEELRVTFPTVLMMEKKISGRLYMPLCQMATQSLFLSLTSGMLCFGNTRTISSFRRITSFS